jgi:hypothetical protein
MMHRLLAVLLLGLAPVLLLAPVRAQDKTAADLFPASVVAYLEVPQPQRLMETLLDHPITKALQENPDYQAALKSPQYQEVQAAVTKVEQRLGMSYRQALASASAGGLFVGVDLPSQGVGILVKAQDAALAEKLQTTALELIRAEAQVRGIADPIKSEKVRDIAVHQVGELYFTALGPWLFATNKELFLRLVVENHAASGMTLSQDEQFQAARQARREGKTAWGYVDLRVLKLTGVLKRALDKKSDNPPAELIAGGILGALPDATYVTAELDVAADRVRLTTTMPASPRAIAARREFYFGADGRGTAPPLLAPKEALLSLSTYRDFASLWRNAPDLFDEQINARMAEAESNLTTLFAGRNFRDEILANLEPGVQLVVTRQSYPLAGGVTPAIKLPAAAAVMRMKNPEETARIFKITYQSLIGFLNVVGGMNGLDPLDLSSERTGQTLIVSAEYLPPRNAEELGKAKMHYNAAPTVAFVGDRFIISSTRPLALELADLVQKAEPAGDGANTALVLDGQTIRAVLADNRSSLVAQNMIQKGHDQAASEKEIDALLTLLKNISGAALTLAADENQLRLSVEVRLAGSH